MATSRSYSLDDLKSSLKTRMAEFEMLNNTLVEAMERGSSEVTIDAIKSAINDVEENIKRLRECIDGMTNKADYSFYDEIKKPKSIKNSKSFFDGIKKGANSKKLDENIKKDISNDCNNLNYEDVYKKSSSNKLPYENVISSNRFLVRFGTPLEIPEYYVRSVNFLCGGGELLISVFNFIKENKHPIIAELLAKEFKRDMTFEFSISIDYLDPTGVTLYTERYHHCHLLSVERDSVDYTRDDFNKILLTVSYSDVTYETSH